MTVHRAHFIYVILSLQWFCAVTIFNNFIDEETLLVSFVLGFEDA